MALPTPPLQDMSGHMALPTPSQQDTDEYYTDELLIINLKIQLYLTHLLNIDQQQKKKRGRKAQINGHTYRMPEYDPTLPAGDWTRDPLNGLQPRQRQMGPGPAKAVRTHLTEYYNRPQNKLPWQKK
ncbi:hypothetical protein Pcinc_019673 [Petrolisthes cinctipes]|uniref:Uncharacterized protein n=1 Tax=Petrolisthes cinctipes TaxID=88211 RepID=A0AAE1FKU5_PETCI|nr:hypothetical protein Pcinc_019673 [Petrolisthes cinctipes]